MTYLYDVLIDMLYPIRARPGDKLVVRPGHERPVVVVRKVHGEWEPIRIGPPNFGSLIIAADAGVIRQRYPCYVSLAEAQLTETLRHTK